VFPLSDDNPTLRTPVMTLALLGVTWAVWLLVQGAGGMGTPERAYQFLASLCNLGLVPGELTRQAPLGLAVPLGGGAACVVDNESINYATPVLSIFLHGSWMHLIGNSLYLWVFGNNVEDSMGRLRFLAFYLLTGVVAAASHVLVDPSSPVPTVGASGAISGVMGAYLLLYPRVHVRTFFPPFFVFRVPAWAVLLMWFGSQVLTGLPQLSPLRPDVSGGVAVWAHIGGFVAGVLLARPFANREFMRRRNAGGDAKVVWS
jgi:membrane associated rhomboid family serine protease